MEVELAFAVTFGLELTPIVILAVAVQAFASVIVTVYVVVEVGDTVWLAPLPNPLSQA